MDFNDQHSYNGSLFNFGNNGLRIDRAWRVYGRFTQRFNNQSQEEDGEKRSLLFPTRTTVFRPTTKVTLWEQMNENHKDDLFKYGYLGKYTVYREPTYAFGIDDSTGLPGFLQGPWNDTLVDFQASGINPNLAYTQQYYDLNPDATGRYENLTPDRTRQGALRNGDAPRSAYMTCG